MAQPAKSLGDLRNFLAATWKHCGLPSPTELQYDVARHLQFGPKKLCLLCFRGFGKSWIASTEQVHALWEDPADEVCLQVSGASLKAESAVRFELSLLRDMPECQHLYPNPEQRSSNREFDVRGTRPKHQASCTALGILSNSLNGARGRKIVGDDIETVKNSVTPLMRERIARSAAELGGAILMPGKGARMRFLGTPQTEESFYWGLRDRGYTILVYPARYPTEEQEAVYDGMLAPILQERIRKDPGLRGQPTEPTRFPEDILLEREAEYGRLNFLMQFMLVPSLADLERYPLRLKDLIIMDVDPETAPDRVIYSGEEQYAIRDLQMPGFSGDRWQRPMDTTGQRRTYREKVMAVDPSGRGPDEIAWLTGGILNSQIHLIHMDARLNGYDEATLAAIARDAKRLGVDHIVVEANYGDGMWTSLFMPVLRRYHPNCYVEEVKVRARKEDRMIDTIEPVVSAHQLIVDRRLVEWDQRSVEQRAEHGITYRLAHQLTHVCRMRNALQHDDRLDVLSILLAHFRESLEVGAEEELQARQEEDFEEELEKWERFVSPDRGKPYGGGRHLTWM